MISNLDNFGLYYVAITEINKVNDVSARNTYKSVIDKYRKQSATPYITDILTKLNVIKKAQGMRTVKILRMLKKLYKKVSNKK